MNDYTYWEKALADPRALRAREYRITSEPQPGFYRDKRGTPVAFFWDEGELVMHFDGAEAPFNSERYENVWLWSATRPVSEEAYMQRLETGKWPDMDAAVQRTLGDNIKDADEVEALQAMLDELFADLSDYEIIEDDDTAARAAGLRNRINELKLRADKLRKDEKEPHLKAGQEVDARWQPLIKDATAATERLRKYISYWETAKLKAAREAEAAQAAKIWPQGLEAIPEPQAQIRPAYGRAQAVKVVKVVTGINEPMALFGHLYATDHEMMSAYLMELAQKQINRGLAVPGVIVEEQARV